MIEKRNVATRARVREDGMDGAVDSAAAAMSGIGRAEKRASYDAECEEDERAEPSGPEA